MITFTQEVSDYIQSNKKQARKTAKTLVRLAETHEIGNSFQTWVEKDGIKVLESEDIVNHTGVISRNPKPLSDGSFNDYIMPKDLFFQHFGEEQYQQLTTEFQPMSKKVIAEVVEITAELKEYLKNHIKDDFIVFQAIFNLEMKVNIGDILVINAQKAIVEYGIDKVQFENTYEYLVPETKNKLRP